MGLGFRDRFWGVGMKEGLCFGGLGFEFADDLKDVGVSPNNPRP